MNERDEALREALRTDALEDLDADLAEALAAVQRTSTLAAQRTTALVEMQRERDEARANDAMRTGMLNAAREHADRYKSERDEARADAATNGKAAERLSGELAEARRELDCWRQAFGETALKDATARLRAALDEERIEPKHTADCDTEEWHPRCDAVGPTGGRCGRLRGPHPTHESSNGSGGSVSWPAERTEGEAG